MPGSAGSGGTPVAAWELAADGNGAAEQQTAPPPAAAEDGNRWEPPAAAEQQQEQQPAKKELPAAAADPVPKQPALPAALKERVAPAQPREPQTSPGCGCVIM